MLFVTLRRKCLKIQRQRALRLFKVMQRGILGTAIFIVQDQCILLCQPHLVSIMDQCILEAPSILLMESGYAGLHTWITEPLPKSGEASLEVQCMLYIAQEIQYT